MPEIPADRPQPSVVDLQPDATDGEVRAFVAEQCEDRPLSAEPGPYPYVVTRHFPAVYSSRAVAWSEAEAAGGPHALVPCDHPYDDGRLRAEARELVVAYARERAATTGFKHCAVFGERDAVYVDPAGATTDSTEPPRWGRTVTRFPEAP